MIHRTELWDVAHAFGTAVESWLVLVPRRHETSLARLTNDEAAELGPLVQRMSAALEAVLGCEKTSIAQFAEAADRPDVHVHVIARHQDQPEDRKGPGVFRHALGVESSAEVPDQRRYQIAAAIAAVL